MSPKTSTLRAVTSLPEADVELDQKTLHSMTSGRRVVLSTSGGGEAIEILSPAGESELCIELTDSGPVVRLKGARLEMEATEDVEVRCKRFMVQSSEAVQIHSLGDAELGGKEVGVVAAGDLQLQGERLFLN